MIFIAVSTDPHLFVCVVRVDVLDGRSHQFRGKLRGHANGQWHSALKGRVRQRTIVVVVVVTADLCDDAGEEGEKKLL